MFGKERHIAAPFSERWNVKRHDAQAIDRKSTRLNSSHEWISYAVFCLKKKNQRMACSRFKTPLRTECNLTTLPSVTIESKQLSYGRAIVPPSTRRTRLR